MRKLNRLDIDFRQYSAILLFMFDSTNLVTKNEYMRSNMQNGRASGYYKWSLIVEYLSKIQAYTFADIMHDILTS